MKNTGKIVTLRDINKLQEVVKIVFDKIKDNPELDEKFRLKKKFAGILGESLAVIKLFELFGTDAKYEWYGGLKRGFDILLIKNEKSVKIQIKTSTDEKFRFRIITSRIFDREKIINSIKNHDFSSIFKIIEDSVNEIETDLWILVHLKKDKNEFYVADKNVLVEALREDYKSYIENKKHRNNTGFGINEQGSIQFMLGEDYGKILKNEYIEKWELIGNKLNN